jgi:hypothetical protein
MLRILNLLRAFKSLNQLSTTSMPVSMSYVVAYTLKEEERRVGINPDFLLGAPAVQLAYRWHIFGYFCYASLLIARYSRLIRIKTRSKSASVFIANPNGN